MLWTPSPSFFSKRKTKNDFTNRFENSFWSIYLIRVNILLGAKKLVILQFLNRICISDSCEVFKKPKNFECLKTGNDTLQ